MELISHHVVLQRLRRYIALGIALMVIALAAISMAFAFRQHLQNIPLNQAPLRQSHVGSVESFLGREWEVLRGEWKLIAEDTLWIASNTLMMVSQPGMDFTLGCSYWGDGYPEGPVDSPSILFRYQSPGSNYRLKIEEPNILTLEKRFEGEQSRLAWVEIQEQAQNPTELVIEIHGARILTWLNGDLLIDYTDPVPLTGEGFGILVDSTPMNIRIHRVDYLSSK